MLSCVVAALRAGPGWRLGPSQLSVSRAGWHEVARSSLRFYVDRGTMVATGVSGELFEIVRTFIVEVDGDAAWDKASEIIERPRPSSRRAPRSTTGPPCGSSGRIGSLLDDLDEVLPHRGRVPAWGVLGALRNLAPKWRHYAEFTVPTLVAELGIRAPRTANKNLIDLVTAHDARARRAAASSGE